MSEAQEAGVGNDGPGVLEIDFPKAGDWLSAEELATLTPEVLRERILAIKPLAAERARSVELNRRPDPEVWAALRKSGIFYMFVPKRFGGLEMTVNDLIDIMVPLGEACASTCWCATFVIEHNVGIIKSTPLERQKAIFAEFPYVSAPGVTVPPGIAVPVEGGYRVSARWEWGSGVMNSDWVLGLVIVQRPDAPPGPPEMASVMIPAREVTVLDTWHVDGMCGTGSNDIAVDDLFVPEERLGASPLQPLLPNADGSFDHDSPVLRIPFTNLLALTTMLPALGIARATVEHATSLVPTRVVLGTETPYSQKETSQNRLGRAETMVRAAELALHDAAAQMMEAGRSGDADFGVRSAIRSQIMLALDLCRDAVRSLAESSGASAHRLDSPLQRYVRDIHVIGNHALYDSDVLYEQRGRAILGLPQSDVLT